MRKNVVINRLLSILLSAAIGVSAIPARVLADGDDMDWVVWKTVEEFSPIGDVVSMPVSLEGLGRVNLVFFTYNELHPTHMVVLTDDENKILQKLGGITGAGGMVFGVFLEDLDGDGREDFRVIFSFREEGLQPSLRLVQDSYRMADGGFSRIPEGVENVEREPVEIEEHYGYYRIVESCPESENGNQELLERQELGMMLGRVVVLEEDFVVLSDCEKRQGLYGEMYQGNHIVQESVQVGCRGWSATPESMCYGRPDHVMEQAVGKNRYWKINGIVEPEYNNTIRFYTMEDTDSIIMESYLAGQYFILEKLEGREETVERDRIEGRKEYILSKKVGEEEQAAVLSAVYGTYTVKEFLPTHYYEGKDDPFLPDREPGWMEGKEITIGEDVFTTYDNYRWSEAGKDREAGKWFQKAEIREPEYRLAYRKRWEIFGLRDEGMLPEGMVQEEYVEIAVYPGLRLGDDRYLPQLFLLDDGRVLMYSMGQYFLLEKTG